MSSATNHKKRSHRSEQFKRGAFNAQSRKAYYRTVNDHHNRSLFGRLASMFHRKAPKQVVPKEAEK